MYCGLGKLRNALAPGAFTDNSGPPTPKSNTAADLTDAQLTDAITEASSIVDSAIGGHYVTPVADVNGSTPHPIDYWTRAIAAYLATCSFRGSQDFTDNDPIYRRYLVATQALTAIQGGKGSVALPVNTGDSATVGASDPINPYTGSLFDADDFNLAPDFAPIGFGMNRPGWWWGTDA